MSELANKIEKLLILSILLAIWMITSYYCIHKYVPTLMLHLSNPVTK